MTFNEDYSMIHKGKVKVTYQDGNIVEQNYNYRDEVSGEREKNWWYVAR
jgi:major membrane immunogen (membrane-anchored lipoprotein)